MKLRDFLDTEKLYEHLNAHVVNAQHHHFAPLVIYNYGQKAQFDCIWDDVTCKARGLIVNQATDEIVARPFAKFFNVNTTWRPETMMDALPPDLPEVTEKMDGSLGILYRHAGMTAIATRGSFASDQAAWASAWYNKHLSTAAWPDGWTPLFEIIYPDNRIVVKYDWEGLILLGMVNIETGQELRHNELREWGARNDCRVVELFDGKTLGECRDEDTENKEGYVCTWHFGDRPPLKIKVKFNEYVRLHRLMTCVSPKEIWRMLKDGENLDELVDDVPPHFYEWVNYWRNGLEAEYGRIEQKAKAIWASCSIPKDGKDKETRKKLAQFFTEDVCRDVSGVLFSMLDGRDYSENIWKMVRSHTRDEQPFKPINE